MKKSPLILILLILTACGQVNEIDEAVIIEEELVEIEEQTTKPNVNLELIGNDLLEEIFNKRNRKYMMSSINVYNELEVETIVYYDGLSYRVESNGMVSIYNYEDRISYFYYENSKSGNIIKDEDDKQVIEPDFSPINNLILTEISTLNGWDVIYLESEDKNTDISIKEWYSIEYGVPLKTLVYEHDILIRERYVTAITSDFDSKIIFGEPNGIELEEIVND